MFTQICMLQQMGHRKSLFAKLLAVLFIGGLALLAISTAYAASSTLTVTPITWNVIGLDSNSPTSGPYHFPV